MANVVTDKLTQARDTTNPVVTTVASARSIGDTSLSVVSASGWPTTTAVHYITYAKTPAGAIDKSTQCDWKGIVSGTTIGSLVLKSGVDAGNSVGDFVEMAPTAAWAEDLYDFGSHEHKTDGTHSAITAASVVTTGNVTVGGNETITGALTAAAIAMSGSLTGTGLASQVTSFTNAGTGAGTFFYVNLAGIKLMWGKFPAIATGSTNTLTLPTFFTTLQTILLTGGPVSGTSNIQTYISSASTSSIVAGLNATTGSGTMALQAFIIGT